MSSVQATTPPQRRPYRTTHFQRTKNKFNSSVSSTVTANSAPASVEKLFFGKQRPPDLLKDYDSVGFDALNGLVQFKAPALKRLVVSQFLHLLSTNWPERYPSFYLDRLTNLQTAENVLWDMERGTILTLAEGKEVAKGWLGSRVLSVEQLHLMYGNPPVFGGLKYPNATGTMESDAHRVINGVLDSCKIPVIRHIVDLITSQQIGADKLPQENYKQLAFDLMEVNHSLFDLKTAQVTKEQANSQSLFYTEELATSEPFLHHLYLEPQKYIKRQPALRELLTSLKSHGKALFVVSNANVPFLQVVMRETLGNDWKSLFDLVVADARQPLFQRSETPFYGIDRSRDDLLGGELKNAAQMQQKVVQQGNALQLSKFLKWRTNKPEVRVAFVGDQLLENVWATQNFKGNMKRQSHPFHWDSILVCGNVGQSMLSVTRVTEAGFFEKKVSKKQVLKKEYFLNDAAKIARYGVKSAASLKNLIPRTSNVSKMTRFQGLVYEMKNGKPVPVEQPLKTPVQSDSGWNSEGANANQHCSTSDVRVDEPPADYSSASIGLEDKLNIMKSNVTEVKEDLGWSVDLKLKKEIAELEQAIIDEANEEWDGLEGYKTEMTKYKSTIRMKKDKHFDVIIIEKDEPTLKLSQFKDVMDNFIENLPAFHDLAFDMKERIPGHMKFSPLRRDVVTTKIGEFQGRSLYKYQLNSPFFPERNRSMLAITYRRDNTFVFSTRGTEDTVTMNQDRLSKDVGDFELVMKFEERGDGTHCRYLIKTDLSNIHGSVEPTEGEFKKPHDFLNLQVLIETGFPVYMGWLISSHILEAGLSSEEQSTMSVLARGCSKIGTTTGMQAETSSSELEAEYEDADLGEEEPDETPVEEEEEHMSSNEPEEKEEKVIEKPDLTALGKTIFADADAQWKDKDSYEMVKDTTVPEKLEDFNSEDEVFGYLELREKNLGDGKCQFQSHFRDVAIKYAEYKEFYQTFLEKLPRIKELGNNERNWGQPHDPNSSKIVTVKELETLADGTKIVLHKVERDPKYEWPEDEEEEPQDSYAIAAFYVKDEGDVCTFAYSSRGLEHYVQKYDELIDEDDQPTDFEFVVRCSKDTECEYFFNSMDCQYVPKVAITDYHPAYRQPYANYVNAEFMDTTGIPIDLDIVVPLMIKPELNDATWQDPKDLRRDLKEKILDLYEKENLDPELKGVYCTTTEEEIKSEGEDDDDDEAEEGKEGEGETEKKKKKKDVKKAKVETKDKKVKPMSRKERRKMERKQTTGKNDKLENAKAKARAMIPDDLDTVVPDDLDRENGLIGDSLYKNPPKTQPVAAILSQELDTDAVDANHGLNRAELEKDIFADYFSQWKAQGKRDYRMIKYKIGKSVYMRFDEDSQSSFLAQGLENEIEPAVFKKVLLENFTKWIPGMFKCACIDALVGIDWSMDREKDITLVPLCMAGGRQVYIHAVQPRAGYKKCYAVCVFYVQHGPADQEFTIAYSTRETEHIQEKYAEKLEAYGKFIGDFEFVANITVNKAYGKKSQGTRGRYYLKTDQITDQFTLPKPLEQQDADEHLNTINAAVLAHCGIPILLDEYVGIYINTQLQEQEPEAEGAEEESVDENDYLAGACDINQKTGGSKVRHMRKKMQESLPPPQKRERSPASSWEEDSSAMRDINQLRKDALDPEKNQLYALNMDPPKSIDDMEDFVLKEHRIRKAAKKAEKAIQYKMTEFGLQVFDPANPPEPEYSILGMERCWIDDCFWNANKTDWIRADHLRDDYSGDDKQEERLPIMEKEEINYTDETRAIAVKEEIWQAFDEQFLLENHQYWMEILTGKNRNIYEVTERDGDTILIQETYVPDLTVERFRAFANNFVTHLPRLKRLSDAKLVKDGYSPPDLNIEVTTVNEESCCPIISHLVINRKVQPKKVLDPTWGSEQEKWWKDTHLEDNPKEKKKNQLNPHQRNFIKKQKKQLEEEEKEKDMIAGKLKKPNIFLANTFFRELDNGAFTFAYTTRGTEYLKQSFEETLNKGEKLGSEFEVVMECVPYETGTKCRYTYRAITVSEADYDNENIVEPKNIVALEQWERPKYAGNLAAKLSEDIGIPMFLDEVVPLFIKEYNIMMTNQRKFREAPTIQSNDIPANQVEDNADEEDSKDLAGNATLPHQIEKTTGMVIQESCRNHDLFKLGYKLIPPLTKEQEPPVKDVEDMSCYEKIQHNVIKALIYHIDGWCVAWNNTPEYPERKVDHFMVIPRAGAEMTGLSTLGHQHIETVGRMLLGGVALANQEINDNYRVVMEEREHSCLVENEFHCHFSQEMQSTIEGKYKYPEKGQQGSFLERLESGLLPVPVEILYKDAHVIAYADQVEQDKHFVLVQRHHDQLEMAKIADAKQQHVEIMGHMVVTAVAIANAYIGAGRYRIQVIDGVHGCSAENHVHLHVLTASEQYEWPPDIGENLKETFKSEKKFERIPDNIWQEFPKDLRENLDELPEDQRPKEEY